jgi:hypothetical protein
MVNAKSPGRPSQVRARQIKPSDRDAVAALLRNGFGLRRTRAFWQQVLNRLERHRVPDGMPQFGYLLESDGRAVGAILAIFSVPRTGADPDAVRCSISSWYVEPAFRSYASLLASQALKHRNATYLNISPAANTVPTLEAQGYARYSDGLLVACPALGRASDDARAVLLPAAQVPAAPFEPFEPGLLRDHADFGCMSFWCVTRERAYPFVFRRRLAKAVVPCAQLIYCRDTADVARFAGLIGRHLAGHLCPLVVIDAVGPLPGLPGIYLAGWRPKFFKGPERPRLGDLAYTEAAMFGM